MLRIALLALFHAAFFGVFVLVVPASGQVPPPPSTLSEVPLPGGLHAALAAVGDRATPDRAYFLAEFIRRTYDTPVGLKGDTRQPVLLALVSSLKSRAATTDTIPLPLTTRIWTDVVFKKQATPETLVASIVQSRNAALLYNGLLSLDDDTRAWIADQPSLISEIVARRAASFLTAAPALHITKAGVQVPGGDAAEPVWAALAGHRASDTNDFVRSLISSADGRLAFFFGTMGQLNTAQIRFALSLDSSDVDRRIDAGRRLYAVFERLWAGRALEQRVFVRPSYDPALLISEWDSNGDGQIAIPGTRGFWTAVFTEAPPSSGKTTRPDSAATITWDQSPDFPWLCEQIFKGDANEHRRHFMMLLFAVRHAAGITRDSARDAAEAVRGAGAYPALSATLERGGVSDLGVYAAAMRRAGAINAIEDETRAGRALAQYQGALAMVARAAVRGSLTADAASKLIASLSAVTINDRGDYEGRIVGWLSSWLMPDARAPRKSSPTGPAADGSVEELYEAAAGPIEEDALRVLTGPQALSPRLIDWEGTRYRLDFRRADAIRITRAQGESSRPYLSSAAAALAVADVLAGPGLTRQTIQLQAQAFARIARPEASDSGEEAASDTLSEYRDVSAALQHAGRSDDVTGAAKLAPSLRAVADDLLARGLIEWAYAAALGPRDGISISASEAASHHDFGLRSGGSRAAAWQLPTEGTDTMQHWRVRGSLLGLDVTLAHFSLTRLSLKPPPRPSLGEIDRRVFIDTLALIDPRALTDADRDTIAAAIRDGRARMKALRSAADVRTVGDAIDMSPLRRTLLSWTIAHDPVRVAASVSLAELFWLGIGDGRVASLDAWGVPAGSRSGCLCVRVLTRRSPDIFGGRWNTGMTASAFPDLNFRLAELLSELHMPAALLAPVLAAATLDFVNATISRDQDDRRGLVEYVQALQADKVEQYLALLTTDGPLVPMGDSPTGKNENRQVFLTGGRR